MRTKEFTINLGIAAGDRDLEQLARIDSDSVAEDVYGLYARKGGLAVDVTASEGLSDSPEDEAPCNWKSDTDGENEKAVACEAPDRAEKEDLDEAVNHPSYYMDDQLGHECIEFTESMSFLMGSAFKYVWRAGCKGGESAEKDLRKARFYIKRAARRITCGAPCNSFLSACLGSAVDTADDPYVEARARVLRDLYQSDKDSALKGLDYLLELVTGESGEHNTP